MWIEGFGGRQARPRDTDCLAFPSFLLVQWVGSTGHGPTRCSLLTGSRSGERQSAPAATRGPRPRASRPGFKRANVTPSRHEGDQP